jgi:hypothetical protein
MIVSASSTAYSTANFTADSQREEGGCCQHWAVQIWAKVGLATQRRPDVSTFGPFVVKLGWGSSRQRFRPDS